MKKGLYFALAALGLALILAGLYCALAAEPQGVMKTLPYILIGIGSGVFGHGTGELLSNWVYKSRPDVQKQIEIEKKDERNVEIGNRAKGKAYDAMIYIFGALILSLALMDTALHVVLMLVAAYLAVIGISIFFRFRYNKKM